MAKNANSPVVVKVKSDGGEIQKGLHLYLFDDKDRLIETAALKNGEAKLKTVATKIRGRSQVIIGPEIPKEFKGRSINPILIKKMGGYQPSINLDRNNLIEIIGLPKFKFPLWDWCLITGNLSKSFNVNGENKVLPVCDARVHICEIDRIKWWWPRIPRPVITDLGLKLKEIILRPEIKFPPIIDPKITINPRIPIKKIVNPRINLDFEAPTASDALALVQLPDNVKRGILSNSEAIVHKTIFDNFHLLHPYLCLWPKYWNYFYKCTKIATVKADCNGNFDYNYLNFTNDKDIYIWVEVNIDGEWVTVYRPRIACNTYWNYKCGKEINIRITDPRVPACECNPLPGAYVWIKRVNTGTNVRSIHQKELPSAHLNNTVGLTWYDDAKTQRVSPFGGSFPFVVKFGDGFPVTGGVTHFRWSYKQLKDALLNTVSDTSHYQDDPISKPYEYDIVTTDGTLSKKGSYPLKDGNGVDGNGKYKIPHEEAAIDTGIASAEYNHRDTSTIHINSGELGDGLYEFTFELLDKDGVVVPVPANTFLVSKLTSDTPEPSAPDADTIFANSLNVPDKENYLIKDGSGNAIAFKFAIRIDNQPCYADVLDASVAGNPTDTECGVGNYTIETDPVILKFYAGQAQDFAKYSFTVKKGNSVTDVGVNTSRFLTQTDPNYSFTPDVMDPDGELKDLYDTTTTVGTMLGSCTMAAFAEVLHLTATHTNGSHRLQGYDAHDVAAIAIALESAP